MMVNINILNSPIVIPETYVQYPGKRPPSELFGGTWVAFYDEDGVFFRTGGGEALPFGEGVQDDAMRNVTGNVDISGGASMGAVFGANGVFAAMGTRHGHLQGANTSYNAWRTLDFNMSRQVPTANEFRPKNVTVRLWERI